MVTKGAALRDRLEQFLKKAQKKAGYEQVVTPHIGMKDLYVTSGHYAKYGRIVSNRLTLLQKVKSSC